MLLCDALSARIFVAAGACLAAAVSSESLWVVKGPFEALRSFPGRTGCCAVLFPLGAHLSRVASGKEA